MPATRPNRIAALSADEVDARLLPGSMCRTRPAGHRLCARAASRCFGEFWRRGARRVVLVDGSAGVARG